MMEEGRVIDYITDVIARKELDRKRPLLVTLRDVVAALGPDALPVLRTLAREGRIHFGRTLNGHWFSIYSRDHLL